MRAVLVVLLITLAGCSGAGEENGESPASGGANGSLPPLAGFIFDPAVTPIAGATVSIPALGLEAPTDKDGVYAFSQLPVNEVLVVVVQAQGYKPDSRSLSLEPNVSVLLNFTLERVPVKTPTHNTVTFKGIIGCGIIAKANGQAHRQSCPGGIAVDTRVWEFNVDPELAGAVVEVVWDAQTPAAEHLNVTIETVGFGELDEVLFSQEYGSILRGQITNAQAARFYTGGGLVRVSVDIGRNTADDEVDVGVAVAAQQDFDIYATLFYIEPPPADFTIADA